MSQGEKNFMPVCPSGARYKETVSDSKAEAPRGKWKVERGKGKRCRQACKSPSCASLTLGDLAKQWITYIHDHTRIFVCDGVLLGRRIMDQRRNTGRSWTNGCSMWAKGD